MENVKYAHAPRFPINFYSVSFIIWNNVMISVIFSEAVKKKKKKADLASIPPIFFFLLIWKFQL